MMEHKYTLAWVLCMYLKEAKGNGFGGAVMPVGAGSGSSCFRVVKIHYITRVW